MPRRIFPLVCLLILLCSAAARAQLAQSIPTKLSVSGARRINVGQKTALRVALLNQQGGETAALNNTVVRVYATRQPDIKSARADAPVNSRALDLPTGRNTVRAEVLIPRGQTFASVNFSSAQSGPIRVYAESDKYATAYTLIAVYPSKTQGESDGDGVRDEGGARFVNAALQSEPAGPQQLFILPARTGAAALDEQTGEYVQRFDVLLQVGNVVVSAPRPVRVELKLSGAAGRVEPASLVINADEYISDQPVAVRTRAGGVITVVAAAVPEEGLAVAPSEPVAFDFPRAKVATGLVVEAVPSDQPTSGRDPITIFVRAVDDEKNTVLGRDEGLDERRVELRLGEGSRGVRFEDGHAFVTLARDQLSGERKIFGSRTVAASKVLALAKNSRGEDISGSVQIGFSFPWLPLVCALLGGACVAVASRAASEWRLRRPRQTLRGALLEAALGGLVGVIFFALVFFGAVAITELNWRGVPVVLDALPVQHSLFAAFLVGLVGGVLLGTRSLLKSFIAGRTLRDAPAA